jgi:hypothetical protein
MNGCEVYKTNADAAIYLGIPWQQLTQLRRKGLGPCWQFVSGKVRYYVPELDSWMVEKGAAGMYEQLKLPYEM